MAKMKIARRHSRRQVSLILATVIAASAMATNAGAQERSIVVASTTSTVNSGLFDAILPQFTKQTQIIVRVVGVGTGQALRIAERGDADVVLVHHKPSERAFVEKGFGVKRFEVMYNDFVIVGPRADPAKIKGTTVAGEAYRNIAAAKSIFVSRGDDSGTHKKSLEIWKSAGIEAAEYSGIWYREAGAGMGATLNIASSVGGYTLTDRATWEKFGNKGDLTILSEGDPKLRNQYGVIMVNPSLHDHVKKQAAESFIKWVVSEQGQSAIDRYAVNGKQVFFANAGMDE
jgi:tungstate transport system substrate-binding protein